MGGVRDVTELGEGPASLCLAATDGSGSSRLGTKKPQGKWTRAPCACRQRWGLDAAAFLLLEPSVKGIDAVFIVDAGLDSSTRQTLVVERSPIPTSSIGLAISEQGLCGRERRWEELRAIPPDPALNAPAMVPHAAICKMPTKSVLSFGRDGRRTSALMSVRGTPYAWDASAKTWRDGSRMVQRSRTYEIDHMEKALLLPVQIRVAAARRGCSTWWWRSSWRRRRWWWHSKGQTRTWRGRMDGCTTRGNRNREAAARRTLPALRLCRISPQPCSRITRVSPPPFSRNELADLVRKKRPWYRWNLGLGPTGICSGSRDFTFEDASDVRPIAVCPCCARGQQLDAGLWRRRAKQESGVVVVAVPGQNLLAPLPRRRPASDRSAFLLEEGLVTERIFETRRRKEAKRPPIFPIASYPTLYCMSSLDGEGLQDRNTLGFRPLRAKPASLSDLAVRR